MNSTSGYDDLVGQIAGFTALRDVDLLELSLLKSIYTIVNPVEVSLVTLYSDNRVKKKVDFASGRHGTVSNVDEASPEFLLACEQLDNSTLEFCTVEYGHGSLSVFNVSQDRKVAHYISIITMTVAMPKAQAHQIMGMLKIYQNFQDVLKESQTDELTGLLNRKSFDHNAAKIHELVVTPSKLKSGDKRRYLNVAPFWLVMVDIDNFKRVNDTQGHLIGDEVLVRIAQALKCSFRSDDFLFRYGGEEFAVILRAENAATCRSVLERVRKSVEDLNFSGLGKVTVSIGAADMPASSFYLSSLEEADKALYHSKKNGRNCVTMYEDIAGSESAENKPNSSSIDLF